MARLDRIAPRIAGAAAVAVVALVAAAVSLKPAAADNDNWRHYRHWDGDRSWGRYGGIYFYSSPGYYAPPPAYYYPPPAVYYNPPPPAYYYPPPPAYYYPPPPYYEGPSFGLSVRVR